MKTIGEKLKEARKGQKMSQNEVAEKLFISRQSISKWENDICLPDLDNFQKICNLYETNPNELLNNVLNETTFSNIEKSKENNDFIEGQEFNDLYYFVPFFFFIILLNKKHKNKLYKQRDTILFFTNIVISLFVLAILYFVYLKIPRTTANISYHLNVSVH